MPAARKYTKVVMSNNYAGVKFSRGLLCFMTKSRGLFKIQKVSPYHQEQKASRVQSEG